MSKRRSTYNKEEYKMAKTIDQLREFEDFTQSILKQMQKLLRDGKSSEEILEFGKALAAARVVSTIATEEDSSKALAAAKDLLDRTQGKAKERVEHEHRYGKLKDEELDALLESRLKEVETDDATNESH